MAKTIERSALGRSGHLGALYDCRTDSFQGDNIFNTKIDDEQIYPTELGNTTVELMMSDSLEDKFHKLNIEAELSVSILCGMIKLSGSAKFLDEKRTSAKKSTMSLIYKVTTMTEEVYLRQLKSIVNLDALESTEATHVLTSVDWGAICTVTAEYEFADKDEKKEIEGGLKAELKALKGIVEDLSGEAKVEFNESLQNKQEKFKFYSKCDVGNRDDCLPVTFKEAVNQAKQLPSLVKATNGGKGVPLNFIFTPLSVVKTWFKIENKVNVIFKTINEESLKRIVAVAQNMTDARQRLSDMQEDIMKGRACISDDEIHEVTTLVADFSSEEAAFRDKLQGLLKDIKSGVKDVSELDKLTSDLEASKFSPRKMDEEISKWENILNKISVVLKAQEKGVKYFGKSANIDVNEKEEMYIFYTEDLQQNTDARTFFWKLHKTTTSLNPNVGFCIVDLSVNNNPNALKDKIAHYKSGKLVSDDFMAKFGSGSLVQFTSARVCVRLPNKRARVILKCPASISGEALCSGDEKEWFCSVCKEVIWYGIDTKMLYCQKCQKQCDPKAALYRCNEVSHGFDFVDYPMEFLGEYLSLLKASDNMNILILGETGVGKSTWINAFANYLYFDTLDAALEGNRETPVVAIPSKFTVFDENGEQQTVFIGKRNENEVHEDGVSNTQHTRTYPFPVGKYIVNLIDTPGIGDTRAGNQDDANMEDILSHLYFYDEIHAILVLLKPNNARLGVFFRHCIQQLLAHLHRDASNNIAFVFTNTRSTFYKPGETFPTLKKLLNEKNLGIEANPQVNMFCFDNEAFRFLACDCQEIKFDPDVRADYERSWRRASKETSKLLEYIKTMTPHQVKNTRTLNDSRRIIVELSRPLQEFAGTIRKNIKDIECKKREADALGNDAKKFSENLTFEGVTLEQENLDFPRTVCTHDDCVEIIPVGKDLINQVNYKTICHEHCNLNEVRPETVGDERLMGCAAMSNNMCKDCGHSYNVHMHRTYDLIRVKKSFQSDEVKEKIKHVKSKKKKAELKKKALEKLVKELKKEEAVIREIGAEFAAFLKTFAIIPFNDAMGEYIFTQIKEEEEKPDPDRETIQELRKSKEAYEKQKEIIEKALSETRDTDEGKTSAAQNIKALQLRAFSLKHFGEDMKKVFDKIEAKNKEVPTFCHGNVPPAPRLSRKRKSSSPQHSPKKSKSFLSTAREWMDVLRQSF